MRNMATTNLRPGMVVGKSILGVDGTVLLAAGIRLAPRYINRLRQLGIPSVYIWDHRTGDLEMTSPIQDSTRLSAARTVRQILKDLNSDLGRKTHLDDEIPQIATTVESILDDLLLSGKLVMDFFEVKNTDDYTFLHSVNVCVLALMMGRRLALGAKRLRELGMGALLHDVGKVLVPGNILNKPGPLSPEEFDQMKKHTTLGYELLCRTNEITMAGAQITLQHHERLDGCGYPHGLKDREISYLARLTSICDVFDALTSDRVYRRHNLPHEAAEYIMGGGGTHFDYKLVEVFMDCIAMYPLGTMVRLNSGQVGIVVAVAPGHSTRPVLRIIQDREGYPLSKPYDLDLRSDPHILITAVLREEPGGE